MLGNKRSVMKIILPVFTILASVIEFSACLTWTKNPDSITCVWSGSAVALHWDYNLTTEEQTASQTAINLIWKRDNGSHFVGVAEKTFLSFSSPQNSIKEPFKPHITVSRSEKATLIFNNVTKEDEGVYQFLIVLLTLNSFTATRNATIVVKVSVCIHQDVEQQVSFESSKDVEELFKALSGKTPDY
ncbi:uncharacterized protein LOC111319506 [Stylophora pistillata]|uniref:uncharacterized protein LOC111319506 n=1 Tax=Stylophora pistillata TaxID=50429 RepID=UPI000C04E894|nr:uncharacterized protein LOC111319506 [Stylophora pistillata]